MIEINEESEIERKRVKEILAMTVSSETIYDKLFVKYPMLKVLRILSWIKRFLTDCKKQQVRGPLTSSEIENQIEFIIKEEQHRYSKCAKSELSEQQLNLKLSEEGLYKFYGSIHGEYLIFVPKESNLAEKLFEEAHIHTIHGGVTLTMAKVRSKYSVPTLRQLVKRVLRLFYGCKNFHVKRHLVRQTRLLPANRTKIYHSKS